MNFSASPDMHLECARHSVPECKKIVFACWKTGLRTHPGDIRVQFHIECDLSAPVSWNWQFDTWSQQTHMNLWTFLPQASSPSPVSQELIPCNKVSLDFFSQTCPIFYYVYIHMSYSTKGGKSEKKILNKEAGYRLFFLK